MLSNVIAPPFRIGTGQITDHAETVCRRADIVVEYSNTLSFPLLQGNDSRLYLAESVCCVVEVKSNLATGWSNVVEKAETLSKLRRKVNPVPWVKPPPPDEIPFFAVGYEGWKDHKTYKDNLNGTAVSGVLVLDHEIYIGQGDYKDHTLSGPQSIFGFLLSIEQLTSSFIGAKPSFMRYVV